MQSRGADPSVRTENYDAYLSPGLKTPREVAIDDEEIQDALRRLEAKYAGTKKVRVPHADIGDWWALYDYDQATIARWAADYVHPYPGAPHRLLKQQQCRSFQLDLMQCKCALDTACSAA